MKEFLFQFASLLITAIFGFLFVWGRYRYQCWKESKAFRKLLRKQAERHRKQEEETMVYVMGQTLAFLKERGYFKPDPAPAKK